MCSSAGCALSNMVAKGIMHRSTCPGVTWCCTDMVSYVLQRKWKRKGCTGETPRTVTVFNLVLFIGKIKYTKRIYIMHKNVEKILSAYSRFCYSIAHLLLFVHRVFVKHSSANGKQGKVCIIHLLFTVCNKSSYHTYFSRNRKYGQHHLSSGIAQFFA